MKKIFADEELSEDDVEEPLQPEKGGKEQGALELANGPDSDEELPEVFTMTQGKSMAQQLRSDERASKQRIAADIKKKREERAAARKSQKPSETTGLLNLEATEVGQVDADPVERSDLLDESIVQFLSKRERSEIDGTVEFASSEEQRRKILSKPFTKRAKSVIEPNKSRVQVVDLSQDSFVEERSAWKFKNAHLYGSRIKRDASMLRNSARAS